MGTQPDRRRSGGQRSQDVGEKESRVGARGSRVTPEEGATATPRRGQAARGQGRQRRRRWRNGQEGRRPMHTAAEGSRSLGAGGPAGGGRPVPTPGTNGWWDGGGQEKRGTEGRNRHGRGIWKLSLAAPGSPTRLQAVPTGTQAPREAPRNPADGEQAAMLTGKRRA